MPTTPSQRQRITYSVLLVASVAFTLYDELHLRRWLYHHWGRNSIVAGSIPNFLAIIVLSLGISVLTPPQSVRDITRRVAAIAAGLVLYEIAQIWMPHQRFDWNDITATFLGGAVTWLLLRLPMRSS